MADIRYPMRLANGTIEIGELSEQEKALSSILTLRGERPLTPAYGSEPYLFNQMIQLGLPFTVTGAVTGSGGKTIVLDPIVIP